MKTDTVTLSLYNRALEQRINDRKETINAQAVKDAHLHAENGKPLPREKSIKPLTGTYTAQWLDMRSEGLQELQTDAHTAKIRLTIDAINVERDTIETRINALDHQNRIAKHKMNDTFISGLRSLKRKGILSIAVFSVAEVAFNAWSLQIVGDSLLFAAAIALGLALANGWMARGIVDYLRKREELGHKAYLIAGGIGAIALSCFIGLAALRTQAMSSGTTHIGMWFFLTINLFFFIATVLVCAKYFPKGTEEAENAWVVQNDEIEKRQAEIDKLRTETKTLTASVTEHTDKYLHVISMARHFAERINSLHRETIELYRSTNLTARGDHATPDAFHEPIADLPIIPSFPLINLKHSKQ